MQKRFHRSATILATSILVGLFVCRAEAQDRKPVQTQTQQTALDRYVAAPDDSYAWSLAKTIDGDGYTGYVIDLTSQTWRTSAEVDRPVWKHWLTVIKPDEVKANTALLYITHGKNGDDPPERGRCSVAKDGVRNRHRCRRPTDGAKSITQLCRF